MTEIDSKFGKTALMCAIIGGKNDIVSILLENKADVEARTITGYFSLHWAARFGNNDVVELLLNYNATIDVNDQHGGTPFMYTMMFDKLDTAKLLLKRGANVNAKQMDGYTPLMLATIYNNLEMMSFFLKNEAEPNAERRDGKSVLWWAIVNGRKDMVELLLNSEATCDVLTKRGQSLLFAVFENWNIDIWDLLKTKIDVHHQDDFQGTVLYVAVTRGNVDAVRLLLFDYPDLMGKDRRLQKVLSRRKFSMIDEDIIACAEKYSTYTSLQLEGKYQLRAVRSDNYLVLDFLNDDSGYCAIKEGDKFIVSESNDPNLQLDPFQWVIRQETNWYFIQHKSTRKYFYRDLSKYIVVDDITRASWEIFDWKSDAFKLLNFRFAVVGNSGAGKTQLVRQLSGMNYSPERDLRTRLVESNLFKVSKDGKIWKTDNERGGDVGVVNTKTYVLDTADRENQPIVAINDDSPIDQYHISVRSTPLTQFGLVYAQINIKPSAATVVPFVNIDLGSDYRTFEMFDIGGELKYQRFYKALLSSLNLNCIIVIVDGRSDNLILDIEKWMTVIENGVEDIICVCTHSTYLTHDKRGSLAEKLVFLFVDFSIESGLESGDTVCKSIKEEMYKLSQKQLDSLKLMSSNDFQVLKRVVSEIESNAVNTNTVFSIPGKGKAIILTEQEYQIVQSLLHCVRHEQNFYCLSSMCYIELLRCVCNPLDYMRDQQDLDNIALQYLSIALAKVFVTSSLQVKSFLKDQLVNDEVNPIVAFIENHRLNDDFTTDELCNIRSFLSHSIKTDLQKRRTIMSSLDLIILDSSNDNLQIIMTSVGVNCDVQHIAKFLQLLKRHDVKNFFALLCISMNEIAINDIASRIELLTETDGMSSLIVLLCEIMTRIMKGIDIAFNLPNIMQAVVTLCWSITTPTTTTTATTSSSTPAKTATTAVVNIAPFSSILKQLQNVQILQSSPIANSLPQFAKFHSILDKHVAKRDYCELHTHLVGMGDHFFWLERVMGTFIPRIVESCDTYDKKVENIRKRLSTENSRKSDMELKLHAAINHRLFTVDVVYPKEILLKALYGKESKDCELLQMDGNRDIEKSFCNASLVNMPFKKHFRQYKIFNARDQTFQSVFGLSNTYLLAAMEWDKRSSERSSKAKAIAARIRNCFSMLNPDGSEATEADLDSYRGNFTPEFYPMRYAMKDPLYHQYPFVLTYLLNNISQRFIDAGIGYAEFSVSINDLAKDVIYEHLLPNVVNDPFNSSLIYFAHFAIGLKNVSYDPLEYYFLAAFPRDQSILGKMPLTAKRMFVSLYAPQYIAAINMGVAAINMGVESAIDSDLEKLFGKSVLEGWVKNLDKISKRVANQYVVGVDLVGDEDGNPFSPFLYFKFKKIFENLKSGNPRFGVRLHAGESVARESSVDIYVDSSQKLLQLNFISHMNIISREILALRDSGCFKYETRDKSGNVSTAYNIRIGHGLAFAADITNYCQLSGLTPKLLYDKIEPHCHDPNTLELLSLISFASNGQTHVLTLTGDVFQSCRDFLKDQEIVFEVCLTSNTTLLSDVYSMDIGSVNGRLLLVHMLHSDFTILLSTDDDGIWPIHKCKRHHCHICVPHEYCRSFTMLMNDPAVDRHAIISPNSYGRVDYCNMLENAVDKSATNDWGKFHLHKLQVTSHP